MASGKSTPKDAQVVASILKDVGIIDYEPRVLNQVLEFAYRYITNVLDDAQLFSTHAKKKTIDTEDVRLAINLQTDRCFTTPPPRELLSEIARQKNSTPLPLIKTTAGPRLPPDRYSLTACNYRLKNASKKPRISLPTSRLNLTTLQASNPATKLNPALTLNSKTGTTLSVVTKVAASPTVTIVSRTPTNTTMPKSTPTPIIKFSDGNRSITPIGTPIGASTTPLMTTSSLPTPQIIMPTIGVKTEPVTDHGEKRKREDDDYDAV